MLRATLAIGVGVVLGISLPARAEPGLPLHLTGAAPAAADRPLDWNPPVTIDRRLTLALTSFKETLPQKEQLQILDSVLDYSPLSVHQDELARLPKENSFVASFVEALKALEEAKRWGPWVVQSQLEREGAQLGRKKKIYEAYVQHEKENPLIEPNHYDPIHGANRLWKIRQDLATVKDMSKSADEKAAAHQSLVKQLDQMVSLAGKKENFGKEIARLMSQTVSYEDKEIRTLLVNILGKVSGDRNLNLPSPNNEQRRIIDDVVALDKSERERISKLDIEKFLETYNHFIPAYSKQFAGSDRAKQIASALETQKEVTLQTSDSISLGDHLFARGSLQPVRVNPGDWDKFISGADPKALRHLTLARDRVAFAPQSHWNIGPSGTLDKTPFQDNPLTASQAAVSDTPDPAVSPKVEIKVEPAKQRLLEQFPQLTSGQREAMDSLASDKNIDSANLGPIGNALSTIQGDENRRKVAQWLRTEILKYPHGKRFDEFKAHYVNSFAKKLGNPSAVETLTDISPRIRKVSKDTLPEEWIQSHVKMKEVDRSITRLLPNSVAHFSLNFRGGRLIEVTDLGSRDVTTILVDGENVRVVSDTKKQVRQIRIALALDLNNLDNGKASKILKKIETLTGQKPDSLNLAKVHYFDGDYFIGLTDKKTGVKLGDLSLARDFTFNVHLEPPPK